MQRWGRALKVKEDQHEPYIGPFNHKNWKSFRGFNFKKFMLPQFQKYVGLHIVFCRVCFVFSFEFLIIKYRNL